MENTGFWQFTLGNNLFRYWPSQWVCGHRRAPQRPEGLQRASEQMSGAEAAQLTRGLIVLWHVHGIQSELVSGVNLKVLPNVPVTRFKLT